MTRCSLAGDLACPNEATHALIVTGRGQVLAAALRCDDHRAEEWGPLIGHIYPGAAVIVARQLEQLPPMFAETIHTEGGLL